jgi:hypothetical protein
MEKIFESFKETQLNESKYNEPFLVGDMLQVKDFKAIALLKEKTGFTVFPDQVFKVEELFMNKGTMAVSLIDDKYKGNQYVVPNDDKYFKLNQ